MAVPRVAELSHGAGSSWSSVLLLLEPERRWQRRRPRCPQEPLSPGWGTPPPAIPLANNHPFKASDKKLPEGRGRSPGCQGG